MEGSRSVARNALARTIGETASKVASIAFFVVMARALGETGFGEFMFALSLATVLVVASGFGFDELVTREVARDRETAHAYLSDTVALRAATCAPLLALGVAIVALGGHGTEAVVAFVLVGVGVAIENVGHSWTSILQALGRQEIVAVALVLQRFATALAGIGVLLLGGGLLAAAAVFLAGSLIGLATVAVQLRRRVLRPRLDVDPSRWRPLVVAAFPIGVNTLIFTVLLKLDQTLLGVLSGAAEVGIYAAAMRLVEATMFIPWAFHAAMIPWLAVQEPGSAALRRGYELALKALTVVLLPVGLAFVVLADPLIDVLYGAAYDDAVLPLRLLGLTTVLYGLNSMAAVTMAARDRPARFTGVLVAITVLNVVLNLVLIPLHGATGAAIAALASGVAFAVLAVRQIRETVGPVRLLRTLRGPIVAAAASATAVVTALVTGEKAWAPEDVGAFLRLVGRGDGEGAA